MSTRFSWSTETGARRSAILFWQGAMAAGRVMVLLVAGLAILIEGVWGLGAGAKIPDPTNIYKEYGMNAFADMRLRFSMTVSIMSVRDKTYLGPKWNPVAPLHHLWSSK